jgi:hypothetical protein
MEWEEHEVSLWISISASSSSVDEIEEEDGVGTHNLDKGAVPFTFSSASSRMSP